VTSRPIVDPYLAGLKMLARRELCTAQVRDRLRRKGYDEPSLDDAIERLRREGALDDHRTATAYARQAVTLKMRGRARTLREIEALGVSRGEAQAAVDEVYATVDEDQLLHQALERRISGRIDTQSQFRRVYRALLRQGFDTAAVVAVLKSTSTPAAWSDRD
jgi:regulatory protein